MFAKILAASFIAIAATGVGAFFLYEKSMGSPTCPGKSTAATVTTSPAPDCCYEGSPCCASEACCVKAEQVSAKVDCCTVNAECCEANLPCCQK